MSDWLEGTIHLCILFVGIGLAASFVYHNYDGESDDMKICELSHSHDVCFNTLNR